MAKKQTMDHAQLLVLSLLAGEDMFGYQMIVELSRRDDTTFGMEEGRPDPGPHGRGGEGRGGAPSRRSDHSCGMKEGTLYPVLHGLGREGRVEAYQQEAPTGRVRKYYHLARRGTAALKEEAQAWQTYSGAVNAVLRACPALGLA